MLKLLEVPGHGQAIAGLDWLALDGVENRQAEIRQLARSANAAWQYVWADADPDSGMRAAFLNQKIAFVSNGVTLEYPPSTANQYKIFGSAPSGETALLAGIDNSQRTSSDRSLDGSLSPLLGGSINNNTSRRVVLVLLTPQIIEGVL